MFFYAGDIVSRVPYIEGLLYPLYSWLMCKSCDFDDAGDTKLWKIVPPILDENNEMAAEKTNSKPLD